MVAVAVIGIGVEDEDGDEVAVAVGDEIAVVAAVVTDEVAAAGWQH